ncbi:sigma-54-dependent transcriptional regulator [Gimesia chilikensis]|uniref:DNA-binding transcriptional regulator NtrC n=1 Tax=Gimesia chilikensis TaxID=2605989 RepID=A0A517PK93_9PLAN|nr:sigma-54 dependent transcriptional regulator [Gimesia chilikensis]MBN71778.1 Fis family transcriptional regulator [Gimesia sp.]MCR9232135.1 sigma-54 dependent transcriptional regulator [bacterium]QDT19787.1 Nitrogen assimilation regulatory protein [Gimesia chilikensis]QDT83877.1 Nitrogen assimilation regulatory protein [Gimesia chilikensis]
MPEALVVDDDRTIREMVRSSLSKINVDIIQAGTAQEALEAIKTGSPEVVLLDIMLPVVSGLDVFREIRELDRRLPVLFITSSSESNVAIEAMQLGAFDYLAKPLDLPKLNDLVLKAIENRRLMNIPVALPVGGKKRSSGDQFVGRSPQMLEVFKSIGRVASENVNVLIRGESGTGKELVARAIYQHSPRSEECFMAVNCAALTETLLESELFGYEKGAFTGADRQRIGKFEQCNGGTIFLDEVGDMSQLTQGKVLRLLQEQKFERVGGNKTIETDVRIIAATNRNLEQMVKDGTFREDLFYRLNGMTISLPPLRKRGNDIALLVEHYLNEACYEMGRTEVEGISSEALDQLLQYRWPGNVRELQSVVRQSLLNSTSPVIVPSSLPEDVSSQFKPTPEVFQSDDPLDEDPALPLSDLQLFVDQRLAAQTKDLYSETLETMERYLLTRVLNETGGNQTRAAEILGITRGKIRDRIAQFGISLEKTVSIDENGG